MIGFYPSCSCVICSFLSSSDTINGIDLFKFTPNTKSITRTTVNISTVSTQPKSLEPDKVPSVEFLKSEEKRLEDEILTRIKKILSRQ